MTSRVHLDLEGRCALVTGGSRGIGLAIAGALHAAGAAVVLTGRDGEAAEAAAATLGDGRAVGVGAHVADERAATAAVRQAVEVFGSLDVLINNAGSNPSAGPLVEQERAPFMKTFEVNLWGPTLWSRLAWEASMRQRGGSIVNVASVGGLTVAAGLGAYAASKAALIHLTRHLALELAPSVRVNAVAPGVVRTRLAEALWKEHEDQLAAASPLGRIGEPDDVAATVAFLASDGARWITGQTLVMDGGHVLAPAAVAPDRA